ncbi:MAG: glycosyltransferase family 39 protein [Candidatus Cloacimonetes bacterium]|nr:glycosyltransferase family 39 protein [Candidatus Cloacimonadota bacterium]
MKQLLIRQVVFNLILGLFLSILTAYAIAQVFFQFRAEIRYIKPKALWIQAENDSYSGYFRKTVVLKSEPASAYLMISANESYELTINGNTVSRNVLFRPTRPFQNGWSEAGQKIAPILSLLSLNFPREYQWSGHDNTRIPTFVDITGHLTKGTNLIAINIESRKAPASLLFEGTILYESGDQELILSDTTWKSATVPGHGAGYGWFESGYDDGNWKFAEQSAPPNELLISYFDPGIYRRPFQAESIKSPSSNPQSDIEFSTEWQLYERPVHAWLRIVSTQRYDLFINDMRVNPVHQGKSDLGSGQWIIGNQISSSSRELLEEMGGEEQAGMFSGNRYENPRFSDNEETEYKSEVRKKSPAYWRATSADEIKEAKKIQKSTDSRPMDRKPVSLTHREHQESFDCYIITTLLKPGTNKIRVKLLNQDSLLTLNWTARFAIDARIEHQNGSIRMFETDSSWKTSVYNLKGEVIHTEDSLMAGKARKPGVKLPSRKYRGAVYNQKFKFFYWGLTLAFTMLVFVIPYGFFIKNLSFNTSESSQKKLSDSLSKLTFGLLPPLCLLLCANLVQIGFAERSESVYFYSGDAWASVLAAAFLLLIWSFYQNTLPPGYYGASILLKTLPNRKWWWIPLVWVSLLCFFLRAWEIDFQTVDDDEYASIQAAIAIAQTGKPQYSESIWYTRSPLYHYATGLAVYLFGDNLFTIRVKSALFGVFTGWVLYLMGARILLRPWVGLSAFFLYSIHPFLIFSSHIGRFYQQQQFFALLTFYFFLRGFVYGQQSKYRLWTLFAFMCAILSQELSAVIGIQMLFVYLLYAAPRPLESEIKLMSGAILVVFVTLVNVMIFQTQTMTRLEGISPNVEATIALNFSSPMNFFSVFFAYSRLHLPLSLILFSLGVLILYDRNRNALALLLILITGVIFTNFFVTAESLRYQYWIIPIWLIISLYSLERGISSIPAFVLLDRENLRIYRRLKILLSFMFLTTIAISFSPHRIIESYSTKILGDASAAFQFIKQNRLPNDKVSVTEPHPHGMLLETNQSDYDIAFPLLYDFVYLDNEGKLRDRNGNAEVIYTVEQMMNVFAKEERLWIAVNREKFRSRTKNLRWEYPGARIELFLRKNCEIKYQSYLWTVFLWDRKAGIYHNFRRE